jgi:methylated-DNA-protein-cysteine methyltransferase related protein
MATKFQEGVIKVVLSVPAGRVVSYGQVAAYLGLPRAARQVGWVLRQMKAGELPWWRVLNKEGKITIRGNMFADANMQRELLRQEGVVVGEDYGLEMNRYRYLPSVEVLRSFELEENYLRWVIEKFRTGY